MGTVHSIVPDNLPKITRRPELITEERYGSVQFWRECCRLYLGRLIADICQELLKIPNERLTELHFVLFNASVTKLLAQPGRVGLSYFNSAGALEASEMEGNHLLTYR